MKADLYVQGNFWATIQLSGSSFAEFLVAGMLTHARNIAQQLGTDWLDLDQAECSIDLRFRHPTGEQP